MTHYSPREQEVLHLVADLHTRAELHPLLGCKPGTVNQYLYLIYDKSEVHGYVELIRYARSLGYGCPPGQESCPVKARLAKHLHPPRYVVERAYKMKNKLIIEGRLT